jgi:tight adherence protein B
MTAAAAACIAGVLIWALLYLLDRRRSPRPDAAEPEAKLPDYSVYRLSVREKWSAVAAAGAVFAAVAYLFYAEPAVSLIAASGGLLYPRFRARQLRDRRLQTLRVQFKQALQAVSSSLGAGKSVETAFADAVQDLRLLYPQGGCLMADELNIILRKLQNGGTIEAAIADLGRRSQLEDARQFAEVFAVCKRMGGNLIDIARRTTAIIGEKLEIEQDIAVMLAQKRFEAKILTAAPLVIIALLKWTAADYVQPLYAGTGRVVMTAALLLIAGCFYLTKRLMAIRV